jgi:stage V sporulation protein D (sporulation-specific penicillin-binding protein)
MIKSKSYGPVGSDTEKRILILRWLVFGMFFIVALRLVQVQIFEHSKYEEEGRVEHSRKWELKADRGTIYIKDGAAGVVPVAMNVAVYNLAVSPKDLRDNPDNVAERISGAIGADKAKLRGLIEGSKSSGYVLLASRLSRESAKKVKALDIYGLFLEPVPQRQYPEGNLAAHTLGFVNTEGKGQYGVEQFYDTELAGKAGLLKSVATAGGDPLLLPGDDESIEIPPVQGKDIVLSLDRNLQSKIEEIAKTRSGEFQSNSVSILVMDAGTGKIKAMTSTPTYDPAEYYKAESVDAFMDRNIGDAQELGSIIKVLTVAAGINEGVVNKNTTYNNTGSVQVGDRVIKNATPSHQGIITITDVLKYSLNTGVVFTLRQLGGGDINDQAKTKLYDYFYNRFRLGQNTGVDVAGEEDGVIFKPDDDEGNAVRYSNMTFGQGISSTPVQAAAALGSVLNGGNYISPSVVESIGGEEVKPKILQSGVVSAQTSTEIKDILVQAPKIQQRDGYRIGRKTGTAQLLDSDGTYSKTRARGTTYGFLETGEGTFVIMVKVEEPPLLGKSGFAGTDTAIPIFEDTLGWIVDYYRPKKL